ncbi:hypothetical protein SK3146_04593 [Paenibacillus konkukensis]|uniref:Uncharacterized protein n=1 Tax=Paenibacillus konkukensis TaxID=2020716 RepID=A0ABY4RVC5_9BACL|nr:hypothetical protein [Paenibacillus konkukensis]UQZ85304.1 hypothetical protein SK3146_04593 [Paenibacillus konkukensis]
MLSTDGRVRRQRHWRQAAVFATAGFLAGVILWLLIIGAAQITD